MSNNQDKPSIRFTKTQLLILIGGVVIGYVAQLLLNVSTTHKASSAKQPLYWVAPMDANYRRDKPGLSPMGMALVPVYEENSGGEDSPGSVYISPAVVNNLGVRTAQAQLMPLTQDIHTVGVVQYDQDQFIHIHPRVAGWVEKLHVKAAGDPVKKDQPLYDLYSPELVNAQQEYIAELAGNNQNLIAAAEERLSALQISQRTIQTLRENKKVQQTVTFYAPQSGVIDNLNIRKGFYIKPDTTMMSIGALQQVWVETEVFERQASLLKPNQKVTMTLNALPAHAWQGKVDYIYPSLDAKNRTLRARLRFNNVNTLLKPNMFAQITIHSSDQKKHLVVPKTAVIRTGQQDRVVLAQGDGRFKSIEVKLGLMTQEYIEILRGLSAGERVVSSAQFLLDSESSKTSDFMRMTHPLSITKEYSGLPSATVKGRINSIKPEQHIINISRGPIEKWNRDAATLDFVFHDASIIKSLKAGHDIEFSFVIDDGEFVVTQIQPSPLHSDMKGM